MLHLVKRDLFQLQNLVDLKLRKHKNLLKREC